MYEGALCLIRRYHGLNAIGKLDVAGAVGMPDNDCAQSS